MMRFIEVTKSFSSRAERWFPIFAALVVVAVACRSAWLAYAPAAGTSDAKLGKLAVARVPRRERPLDITPHGVYRDLLTDEELAPIVATAEPCWSGPGIGHMLHALRLWGPDATFGRAWQPPGQAPLSLYPCPTQLKVLLEHPEFERVFVQNFTIPTFLDEGAVGISVLTKSDADIGAKQGQFHVDKLLQVLGEIGIPASTRVIPRARNGGAREWTVNDILNESLWMYSPFQEPDFTVSAYSRWLRAPATWTNRFGVQVRLDDVVDRLLKSEMPDGVCTGAHVVYALVSVLRANRVERIVSDDTAERIEQRLRRISQRLTHVQRSDGSWPMNWSGVYERQPNDGNWYLDVPPYPELYATGHHLEWIALAPPEVGPPREVVRRAVDYLKTTITAMPQAFFAEYDVYPLGTHAVRALCLIRGVAPWEIRQRYPVTPAGVELPSGPENSSRVPKGDGT